MRVAVIGTGYVGLVVGACLAETGRNVICVDIDEVRIARLRNGEIPIFEPGVEALVKRNLGAGRLSFTTDTVDAVRRSEVIFLAVPTPSDEDGSADLKHVLEAARQVAAGINGYKIIVDKSTVPVGTAARVRELIAGLTDQPFDVVSHPEFLKEGAAVEDFMKPDRIIIGCDNPRAEKVMEDLYAPFTRTGYRIIKMRVESAELTKYTANALLATRISFMNEIARLCEKVGADVGEVRLGIGSDRRIGSKFLFPGMGFGGSCFPKDLRALNHIGRDCGVELKMVRATIEANEAQKRFIPAKIRAHFAGELKGLKFAVWGLTFKANTDDMRESPVLPVLDMLLEAGAVVNAYDPQGMENCRRLYGDRVRLTADCFAALKDADALVVATEWNEFRRPDLERMKRLMRGPVVFDGRNLFDPAQMKGLGFTYYGVGTV